MDNLTFAFPRGYFKLGSETVGWTPGRLRTRWGNGLGPSYLLGHFWLIITYFGTCDGILALACLQMFVTR